jgi:hypothetical protein
VGVSFFLLTVQGLAKLAENRVLTNSVFLCATGELSEGGVGLDDRTLSVCNKDCGGCSFQGCGLDLNQLLRHRAPF